MIIDVLIPVGDARREVGPSKAHSLVLIQEAVFRTGNHIYHTATGVKDALRRALTYDLSHTGEEASISSEQDFDAWVRNNTTDSAAMTDEEKLMAGRFDRQLSDTSRGRPFGVTSKGYICVLQHGMRPGDVVAILRGGRVPYILRPTNDGDKYVFLGEVYVQGLMKGEALLLGDLSEKITLV